MHVLSYSTVRIHSNEIERVRGHVCMSMLGVRVRVRVSMLMMGSIVNGDTMSVVQETNLESTAEHPCTCRMHTLLDYYAYLIPRIQSPP